MHVDSLRPQQISRNVASDVFKYVNLMDSLVFVTIALKFVRLGPVQNET